MRYKLLEKPSRCQYCNGDATPRNPVEFVAVISVGRPAVAYPMHRDCGAEFAQQWPNEG